MDNPQLEDDKLDFRNETIIPLLNAFRRGGEEEVARYITGNPPLRSHEYFLQYSGRPPTEGFPSQADTLLDEIVRSVREGTYNLGAFRNYIRDEYLATGGEAPEHVKKLLGIDNNE